MLISSYDKSKSYTNLIIVAGYVGFFTFWRSAKNDLPKITMLISGLLITIPLCLFISSEVYNMINNGLHLKKTNQMLRKNNYLNIVNQIQERDQEYEDRSYRIWFILLVPTIITAALGAILLITSFAIGLIDEIKVLLLDAKLPINGVFYSA